MGRCFYLLFSFSTAISSVLHCPITSLTTSLAVEFYIGHQYVFKFSMEGVTANDPREVHYIITIIINIITSPLTVLLNVLVIIAVIRTPRLQSYPNILLSCLAATDILTGLITQPLFILCEILQLFGMNESEVTLCSFHNSALRTLSLCSCLHLMLITCDRLIAIKFTLHYPYVVTTRNIKLAVITVWIFCLIFGVLKPINNEQIKTISFFLIAFTFISCTIFIVFSYLVLYQEVLRHQKKIKTQQVPQEEVERFAKEHKALKTTVFVVGAVLLCFGPLVFAVVLRGHGLITSISVFRPWIFTFLVLNSLLDPLIYCWRQQEMRKFAFKFKRQARVLSTN